MPGFGLDETDVRTGILVHPTHDGGLYLASIGCLNPSGPLGRHDDMAIHDSRERLIALLESLKDHDSAAFKSPPCEHAAVTVANARRGTGLAAVMAVRELP